MNRRTLGCLLEVLETLLITLVIFLVVQLFVAQPFRVQQSSMENTLMPDEYVLVDKITPHFGDYHRGDIVVFNPPAGWVADSSGSPFVKRIIGLGGDTVDIHGGRVYVNGTQLVEPYVYDAQPTDTADGAGETWRLAPGQLFVMGDHRQDSRDSRDFGPIDTSSFVGRAWLRYWPLSQFGLVSAPRQSPANGGTSSGSAAASAP